MLAKRIIPCLDVDRGRVVKGIRFVSLVDAGDPVEQAKRYDARGRGRTDVSGHYRVVDKRDIVAALVRRVADEVFIPFTVGGGLRSLEDIRAVLRSGADKVSLNTAAIEQPDLISEGHRRSDRSAWLLPWMPGDALPATRAKAGRSIRTAGGARLGLTRSNGLCELRDLAQERFS